MTTEAQDDRLVRGDEVNDIIGILEEKGITPMHGVYTLISALYRILEANGYSKMEMCRCINESIMKVEKQMPSKESLQ